MKLIEHLEHIIGLLERGESPAKIKASLVAMTEEVSGYEQAATKAIKLAEKQPQPPQSTPPEIAKQLLELQDAVLELKRQLQKLRDNPPDAQWS